MLPPVFWRYNCIDSSRRNFSVPKFAVSEQIEDAADDHDQEAVVAAVPVVGGSTPRGIDTEDYASTMGNIRAAVSGKASSAATKRSRSAQVPNRTKATRANAKNNETKNNEKEAPSAPLTVSVAPTVAEVVPTTPE